MKSCENGMTALVSSLNCSFVSSYVNYMLHISDLSYLIDGQTQTLT